MGHPGKKKAKVKSRAAAPKQVSAESAAPKEGALEKVARTLTLGNVKRALELLDACFPRAASGPPERLRWLASRLPAQAALEVLSLEDVAAGLEVALPWLVLRLDEAGWATLASLEHPLLEEGRQVRAASARISAGEDVAGLELLKGIGLRSPLREARLFLRGLSAFYQGEREEALRALGGLARGEGPFASGARAVLLQQGEVIEGALPSPALSHPWSVGLELMQLYGLLKAGQVNSALRLGGVLAKRDPLLAEGVRRLFQEVLLEDRERDPTEVIDRLHRGLGVSGDDPEGKLALGRLAGIFHELEVQEQSLLAYEAQLRRGRVRLSGQDQSTVIARLKLHRAMGLLELERYEAESGPSFEMTPWYGYEEEEEEKHYREQALVLLREAVELAPGEERSWWLLLGVLREAQDEAEAGRLLEQMIARFPENPRSWLEAARAAAARRSYHKASRHIERAIELEPISRELRSVQAEILMGMARKYEREGKQERAEAALAEALALPYLTHEALIRVRAEGLASLHARGEVAAFRQGWEAALAVDSRRWLLGARVFLGLEQRTRSRRVYGWASGSRYAALWEVLSEPSAPAPDAAEMALLLAWIPEMIEELKLDTEWSGAGSWRDLLLLACTRGVDGLQSIQQCKQVYDLIGSAQVFSMDKGEVSEGVRALLGRMRIVGPDDPMGFVLYARYELRLQTEGAWFDAQLAEVERLRAIQSPMAGYHGLLNMIEEDLEDRRSELKRKKKGSRKKR